MKLTAFAVVCVATLAAVSGAPTPADENRPEIIEIIAPAANAQETLSTLNLGAPGSELSERNKRTIGILRQLFPTLTQIIEQKVQQITSFVLKTFGPTILRSFLGNRNGGDGANSGGGSGTVELDDDDDDDDDGETLTSTTTTTTTTTTTAASAPTDEDKEDEEERRRRKRALFFVPGAAADDNGLLAGAESQQAEVRVAFGEGSAPAPAAPAAPAAPDQQVAASEDQAAAAAQNSATIDEIQLDDIEGSEENRDKRFLSFGGNGGGSSSGGGSGNFLFDIVRQAPGAMARAAGTAFRLFAGTDSLNVGLSASHSATLDSSDPQLVAGSSAGSSSGDGGAGDGEDGSAAKGDNLTEGVPGPVTRLFIIANRGIANLIQDLILRIAQTSERIVNFKARLITSII